MVCRFYALGPPGILFFIMAAAIGAYSPVDLLQVPLYVGLFTMGCLQACLIAFFYGLYIVRLQAPAPVAPLPPATFDHVVLDSVVIGLFVGISLAAAHALQLERAYWVPVSCVAVIQASSLRAVWNKQLHRILGTGVGLLLTWGLLALPLDKWSVSLLMIGLSFLIETLVVRHASGAPVRYRAGIAGGAVRRRLPAQPALSRAGGPAAAAAGAGAAAAVSGMAQ